MRTTRVQPVPSSIFRNSRQYLHSNELFYRTLQEGESRGRQQRGQQQGKNAQATSRDKKRVLKKTQNKFIVKGIQLDADTAATMRNSLLDHAMKINAMYKRKERISTYRSSV